MTTLRYLPKYLACAAVIFGAGNVYAAELPDGLYDCSISSFRLGQIEISQGVYRGPAHDRNFEGDYPFEVTESGTINWGGPLGGISTGGNKVVSTEIKDAGGGRVGFDIMIQNERGNFQTISCSPE
ncbi:MAG: hypothetical protein JWM58_801 [Rhizobium sp.]|nr:hypothetical protein [Rhizobium sp.]